MNKNLIEQSREFLDGFTYPINYDELTEKLNALSMQVCKDYGIPDKFLQIEFIDDEKFGKVAQLSNSNVKINRLRIEALNYFKFDDTKPRKLKKFIKQFMNDYDEKSEHNQYEKMLYKFVENMMDYDGGRLIYQSGSYRTLQYDFLDIIYHENRHIKQKTFIPMLKDLSGFEPSVENLIFLFTMLHMELFSRLVNKKIIELRPPENHKYPIEFDARYASLITLEKLRSKYYPDDELFKKYMVNSVIIPEEFDVKKESAGLFEELEKYFKLEEDKKYQQAYDLVCEYKQTIIKELERRFNEMIEIK